MEGLVNAEFWMNRRVFVTGHTGFKGSWLSLVLLGLGARVRGLALAPESPRCLFNAAGLTDDVESVIADIREPGSVDGALSDFAPEVIFHLAAQPLVRRSYRFPVETYQTNVMGTVYVLEAIRLSESVRAAVIVTSDKCYDNDERATAFRETDALGGADPYSSSKGAAELVTAAYSRSYFRASAGTTRRVGIASARAANVMGGGDWSPDRLVPDLIDAFLAQRRAAIRNPEAERPWQHVLEPIFGYLMLAEKLSSCESAAYSGAWNFGPNDEDVKTVGEIAAMFARAWPGLAEWEACPDEDAPHEAQTLRVDISKARAVLGWTPRWSIDEAVSATASWYIAAANGENMRRFSLGQIESYLSKAPA